MATSTMVVAPSSDVVPSIIVSSPARIPWKALADGAHTLPSLIFLGQADQSEREPVAGVSLFFWFHHLIYFYISFLISSFCIRPCSAVLGREFGCDIERELLAYGLSTSRLHTPFLPAPTGRSDAAPLPTKAQKEIKVTRATEKPLTAGLPRPSCWCGRQLSYNPSGVDQNVVTPLPSTISALRSLLVAPLRRLRSTVVQPFPALSILPPA